jgi:CheY-like chemotaxis protein
MPISALGHVEATASGETAGLELARRGLVLLVDDEPTITRGYARSLTASGFTVEIAHNGTQAAELFQQRAYDVIVSDISMPGMNGLELLRAVREHDLDVPVIIMTGAPAVQSAVEAMEYGAYRYLVKPIDPAELEEVLARAVRLHQMARVRREALEQYRAGGRQLGDRAGLEARFENALATIWIAYQPIISWSKRTLFAYEALVRNEEPALRNPGDLFDAADRLGRLHELGQIIRQRVADTGHEIDCTRGQVGRLQHAVEVRRRERIALRRHRDDAVPGGEQWRDQRHEPQQRIRIRAENPDDSDRLVHRQGHSAQRDIVHRAVVLVGPCRVREQPRDRRVDLTRRGLARCTRE